MGNLVFSELYLVVRMCLLFCVRWLVFYRVGCSVFGNGIVEVFGMSECFLDFVYLVGMEYFVIFLVMIRDGDNVNMEMLM